MNYPVIISINLPTGEGNRNIGFSARGMLFREPRVGQMVTMSHSKWKERAELTFRIVEEDLSEPYIYTDFENIDPGHIAPDVPVEELAQQFADLLKKYGWEFCNQDGSPLDPEE
jgi:hypothetical protein